MEALAHLLGGLGLFLLGMKGLSGQLTLLAGPRLRAVLARGTANSWQAAGLGLAMGLLTQSSQAVTVIIASLRLAGLIAARPALPMLAWANTGTAALVLLATFDLFLAALWLLGLVGLASFTGRRAEARWRPFLLGLGLMLLGLGLLKMGAPSLREAPLLREALALAEGLWLPAFLLGMVAALASHSSSTVAVVLITFKAAGLLSFDQAVAGIYGASLGSGLAIWLLAGQMQGSARQVVLYQAVLRGGGALLFLALLELERASGLPLVTALAARLVTPMDTQLAVIFLLLQLGQAVLAAPLNRPAERWLTRLAPPSAGEALARPRHISPAALEDATSALTLAEAEQARLLERLPGLLDPVRPEAGGGPGPDSAASAALEAEIRQFLAALLRRDPAPEALREAVRLRERLGLLASLRETLVEFVAAQSGTDPIPGPITAMGEALHLLMEELREMRGAEAARWLIGMTADRGEMMAGLRRAAAGAPSERIFLLTGLFERAVWLARRLALLEAERV